MTGKGLRAYNNTPTKENLERERGEVDRGIKSSLLNYETLDKLHIKAVT